MRISRMTARRHGPSLTALIDVVFLLLLFFMLVSTFGRFSHVDIRLAGSAEGTAAAETDVVVLLTVTRDDTFAVNGRPVEAAGLVEALQSAAGAEKVKIIIRPSSGATAQATLSALDLATASQTGAVILAQ